MTRPTDEPMMSAPEVADWLSMSLTWVWAAARSGELPSARFGRAYRFRREDVEAFIADRIAGVR